MSYPPLPPVNPPPLAPIPVAPLEYSYPARRSRPGILTAVGVISVIVASLGILANLWGAFTGLGFLMMSRMPARVFVPPPTTLAAPAPVNSSLGTAMVAGVPVDPAQSDEGIAEDLRPRVIAGMTRARFLDEQRTRQLELLLTVAGKSMFPFVSQATTAQTIRANVSESGRLPSASGDASGPDYFIIGTGRVEVYDDHAIFRPDGSINVVSVMAPTGEDGAPPPTATPPAPPAAQPGSAVTVTGPGGTTTTPAATRTINLNPFGGISPVAAGLSIVECVLSLALAVFLLVAGILVLRDSRRGGRLHWWYVGLKIPLVIFAVAVNVWLMSGLMNSVTVAMPPGAGPPPPTRAMTGVMAASAIVGGGIALAYPLALIFVLMSRTVRDYYSATND